MKAKLESGVSEDNSQESRTDTDKKEARIMELL
jgi:hypothetical protein